MIYRRVNRPPQDVLVRAAGCTTADVHDELGADLACRALMGPAMRPLVLTQRASGPAITAVSSPGDNLMVHRALSLAQPGDILVIVSPDLAAAQWGVTAAVWARTLGLAGVVVDGAIRDAAELAAMDPPVWYTAISAIGTVKRGGGAVNVPVSCAGVIVNPGDLIVADGDGVVAIPRASSADVVDRAIARLANAERERAKLATAGESLYDRRDYGAIVRGLGVEERDRAWDD